MLIKNKTEKENDSNIYVHVESIFWKHVSTYPAWTAPESLTVGPPGPLVRFDWSSLPSSFSVRAGRNSGEARRRTVAPFGKPRPPEVSGDRGDPTGGRFGLWGGRSCRRRAPQRTVAVGQSEFLAPAVPDQNRAGGWTHERERGFLVKRVERGRPWLRQTEPGGGGGRTGRSGGRRPLPLQLTATGALGVRCEAACVLGGARGASFYSAPTSVRGGSG